MAKLVDGFFRLLEFLVVACMVAMVVMVFGNVVLRWRHLRRHLIAVAGE